mmetsp:Transcript_44621/g.131713  ORF Transcript_44621/g.131713 Transcript_44621/m.131713 type:complete len:218 (-) Transcript_44621:1040-1693(-)
MARTTGLSASTRLRVACVSALVECARTAACARRNAQGARVSGVVAWWRGGVVARWRGGLPLGPQVDRADVGNDCTPMLLHALDRLVPHHRVDDSLDAEMLDHAARHHVRQLRGTAAYNRGLVASDKEAESSATALCQLRLHPLRRDVAAHRTDDAVDGRVPDHRLAALDPSAVRDVREGVDDVTQQRGILEHLLHQRHQRKRRARILPIARNEVRTG